MSAVFLKIVNLSISAGWLILAVVVVRFVLKKAPKWISCVLWALVAVRLIFPFSLESAFSLIPSSETIPVNIEKMQNPVINTGIPLINEAVNPVISRGLPAGPVNTAHTIQDIVPVLALVWIAGMAVMLFYALISYVRLKKSVGASVPVRENIYACDEAKSPFILGIRKPLIYVPSSMTAPTLDYVISHENAHIQRHDHWWKPLGFLLLTIYWFHPLCWLAYILLCRDIEMACDEKVIRDMDKGNVAQYSQALLDCSFPRRRIAACPLAFGEVGVKERVTSVLNYKRPAFWIIIAAVLVCGVVAVCFMTSPFSAKSLSGKLGVSMDMAVRDRERSSHADGTFFATDYDVLRISKEKGKTSVYAWIYAAEYSFDGIDVKQESASHTPAVVTFDTSIERTDRSSYDLLEYWIPRDGTFYEEDIRDKFPKMLWSRALDVSGAEIQREACRQAAREYYRSPNHPAVISQIIDPTKSPGFSYDTAVEKFFEDEENEYFFRGIYSKYVIVRYEDGREEDIVSALCAGRVDITDLDRFQVRYWREPKRSSLEEAMSKVILEHNVGTDPDGLIHVESHTLIGKAVASATPGLVSDKSEEAITYYLLMHYESFSTYGGKLEVVGGSALPIAITFRIGSEGEYLLDEYWEPGLGRYYSEDVRKKFPAEAAELALGHREYWEELKSKNWNKAVYLLNNSNSIDEEIAGLLEIISSSPKFSSNTADYIREHQIEYDALVGYGKYTLQYCYSEFLNGEKTNLKGHIMAFICQDIAASFGEEALPEITEAKNGQNWFDLFLQRAQTLAQEKDVLDIEKYYPASFLLLQMTDKRFDKK